MASTSYETDASIYHKERMANKDATVTSWA